MRKKSKKKASKKRAAKKVVREPKKTLSLSELLRELNKALVDEVPADARRRITLSVRDSKPRKARKARRK